MTDQPDSTFDDFADDPDDSADVDEYADEIAKAVDLFEVDVIEPGEAS